jgi:hypothetical protein
MAGHGEKMSRRQEQAIAALLTEDTVEQAATKAKVPYRTLKHWLTLPAFQTAYRQARTQLLERVVSRLLTATTEAVATLKRNLTCGKPGVEVRSALAIIQQGLHGVETLDLEAELAELRAIVERITADEGHHAF